MCRASHRKKQSKQLKLTRPKKSIYILILNTVSNLQIALDSSTSNYHFIISEASGLFNHAANKENGQRTFQRLFAML